MHFTNKHTLLCCLIVAMLAFVKSHPLMDNQYLDDEQYEVPYQVYYGEINDEHNLIRERRSPDQVYDNGHVRGEVNRDNNGNTNVAVGAQGNIYKDKARSVDAEAQWSKVISGPGRAKPQVSGRITYRW
uniref:Putative secreted protein n=1 Tax=Xenopsylla cheopis TaxID=163159 RepID=A0A6M2DXX7_XENCH